MKPGQAGDQRRSTSASLTRSCRAVVPIGRAPLPRHAARCHRTHAMYALRPPRATRVLRWRSIPLPSCRQGPLASIRGNRTRSIQGCAPRWRLSRPAAFLQQNAGGSAACLREAYSEHARRAGSARVPTLPRRRRRGSAAHMNLLALRPVNDWLKRDRISRLHARPSRRTL